MLTVSIILILAAFCVAVAAAMNKAPLWVAVVLLAVVLALQYLPVS